MLNLEDINIGIALEKLSVMESINDEVPPNPDTPIETPTTIPNNNTPIPPLTNVQIKPIQSMKLKPNRWLKPTDPDNLHFNLYGGIGDMEPYVELIAALNSAPKGTTITIHIASGGGSVNTATIIADAIFNSKAKVITVNEGMAASAAAFLLSCGDFIDITPMSFTMFHMSSHFDYGNSGAIEANAKDLVHYVKTRLLSVSIGRGLLMQDEVDNVISKYKNLFIDSTTMKARADKWNARSIREESI